MLLMFNYTKVGNLDLNFLVFFFTLHNLFHQFLDKLSFVIISAERGGIEIKSESINYIATKTALIKIFGLNRVK